MARDKKNQSWTEEEDNFLLSHVHDNYSFSDIGKALGRSASGVNFRVRHLRSQGKLDFAHRPWTEKEESYLREHRDLPASEIAEHLNRSTLAVYIRRRNLGLVETKKPWSEKDRANLHRLFKEGKRDEEIADEIGRTVSAVRRQRQAIDRSSPKVPWTKDEDSIFLDMRNRGYTYEQIARTLNRSVASLNYRRKALGLPYLGHMWTDAEDQALIEMRRRGLTATQMAEQMGKSVSAVITRIQRLRKNERWPENI